MFKRPVGYSALLSLFFLSVMFLTRVVLLLMVPAGSGLTLGLILKSFMIGLVFDLGTLSYCLIPVALYCLLVPKRLATHWIQDYAALVFAATVVAVLLFNGVSEYLFFDEATSSLDANNEKIIMENLEQFFEGKTAIVIAHRLSTVKHADKIIVLDKRKVVEEGSHTELVALKGEYYRLVKNQLELGK